MWSDMILVMLVFSHSFFRTDPSGGYRCVRKSFIGLALARLCPPCLYDAQPPAPSRQ